VRCNRDCVIYGAVCELEWVHGHGSHSVDDVSHDQPFKVFHGYSCECYLDMLAWHSWGLFEIYRYYSLSQREVENVGEDTCQLVSA
jgi:hypothetical protein